jgi:hypothetical protein
MARMQSPVMNVTRKPHLRRTQPLKVGGQRKYAPKYAAERPDDLEGVMLSDFWKWGLRTSRSPYAKPLVISESEKLFAQMSCIKALTRGKTES